MTSWTSDAFIAGHPVLDFVNTVGDQNKQREIDLLTDWEAMANWFKSASIFTAEQTKAILTDQTDQEREISLNQLRKMRELAYKVLSSSTSGAESAKALNELEALFNKAHERAHLVLTEYGYQWQPNWQGANACVDGVVLAIERLLCSKQMANIRECQRCTWVFLNTGRGRGRQWCSMKTCGNRAKSASFKQRHR
jgi:predicted RNA-binding Zn ribbon-like protein